jgi:hypothetical protein
MAILLLKMVATLRVEKPPAKPFQASVLWRTLSKAGDPPCPRRMSYVAVLLTLAECGVRCVWEQR